MDEIENQKPKDSMSDLFDVPQMQDNDMTIDHLLAAPKMTDDMSDLTKVTDEDVMGTNPQVEESEVVEEELPGIPADYNESYQPQYKYINTPLGSQSIRKVRVPQQFKGVQ